MNRIAKIAGALVGGLVLVVAGLHFWSSQAAEARLNQTWPDVVGKDLPVPFPLSQTELAEIRTELEASAPQDSSKTQDGMEAEGQVKADPLVGLDLEKIALERAIERGSHLFNVRLACAECHGAELAGRLVVDAQPVWTWYAPNISSGGVVKDYTAADWDRIIRHGVKPDNRNATMPAIDYMALSDREVSDLIAYAQSMPPKDDVQPPTVLGPVGRMLVATGKMPIAAELIDHSAETVAMPPDVAINAEYGAHIAQPCVGCHRLKFEGGPIAAGPPDWPPAPNLTQAGDLVNWSEEDFLKAMRTGQRPSGEPLNPQAMPWPLLAKMSDLELKAIWAYLSSLDPVPTGT